MDVEKIQSNSIAFSYEIHLELHRRLISSLFVLLCCGGVSSLIVIARDRVILHFSDD